MITARERIIARLGESLAPVPLHLMNIDGVSQTSASARLRELAREGIVVSVPVPGHRYTAWILANRLSPCAAGRNGEEQPGIASPANREIARAANLGVEI